MHSIKHFSFLFTCFLISVFLSACGAKGNLYQVVESESEQNILISAPQQKNADTNTQSNTQSNTDTIKKSK